MSKRMVPPLAYSDYVSPEPENSTQVWRARTALIDATKRVLPEFLDRLSERVFPLYGKLAREGFDFDQILWVHKGLSPFTLLPDGALKSALTKWADDFNSGAATWLLDQALQTLRFWSVAPEKRKLREWYKMHSRSGTASMGEPFRFECEGWETEGLRTWRDYRKSVLERCHKRLSVYEGETRALAESQGLVRARRKHSPDNFEWFVLYQFGSLSSTQIAERSTDRRNIDESTVRKGVKAAAKLAGWPPSRTPHTRGNRKIG